MSSKVKVSMAPLGLPMRTMFVGFILSGLAHYYIAPHLYPLSLKVLDFR